MSPEDAVNPVDFHQSLSPGAKTSQQDNTIILNDQTVKMMAKISELGYELLPNLSQKWFTHQNLSFLTNLLGPGELSVHWCFWTSSRRYIFSAVLLLTICTRSSKLMAKCHRPLSSSAMFHSPSIKAPASPAKTTWPWLRRCKWFINGNAELTATAASSLLLLLLAHLFTQFSRQHKTQTPTDTLRNLWALAWRAPPPPPAATATVV